MRRRRRPTRALWVAVVAVVVTVAVPAHAVPVPAYPTVSGCLPQQVTLRAHGTLRADYNTRTRRTSYEIDILAWVQNVSPVPCLLTGVPTAHLSSRGQVLPVADRRQQYPITDAAPLATTEQLLWPRNVAQAPLAWLAPWCHPPVRASLSIDLAVGSITSAEVIPSPPCPRGSRGPSGLFVDAWSVPPGQ